MERIVKQALLYDFYGELLTEHQKQIYEDVVLNDYSLSEIAQDRGISRQGVHDLIRRCNNILEEYERKLRLLERFLQVKQLAGQIDSLIDAYKLERDEELLTKIGELTAQIREKL